jgi:hypothetical protein
MVKVSDVDSINKQLDDLGVPQYNRITIEDLPGEFKASDMFCRICTILLEKLHTHNNQVHEIVGDLTVTSIDKAIECRQPHFLETASILNVYYLFYSDKINSTSVHIELTVIDDKRYFSRNVVLFTDHKNYSRICA